MRKLSRTFADTSQLLERYDKEFKALRRVHTCDICQELMCEACVIACGHTFCYSCLLEWFMKSKTCPSCRLNVTSRPYISFKTKETVELLIDNLGLYDESEDVESIRKQQRDQAGIVSRDKQLTGHLFPGMFQKRTNQPFFEDVEDGVRRCPDCHWELEGRHCSNCDLTIELDSDEQEESQNSAELSAFSGEDNDSEDEDLRDILFQTGRGDSHIMLQGRDGGQSFITSVNGRRLRRPMSGIGESDDEYEDDSDEEVRRIRIGESSNLMRRQRLAGVTAHLGLARIRHTSVLDMAEADDDDEDMSRDTDNGIYYDDEYESSFIDDGPGAIGSDNSSQEAEYTFNDESYADYEDEEHIVAESFRPRVRERIYDTDESGSTSDTNDVTDEGDSEDNGLIGTRIRAPRLTTRQRRGVVSDSSDTQTSESDSMIPRPTIPNGNSPLSDIPRVEISDDDEEPESNQSIQRTTRIKRRRLIEISDSQGESEDASSSSNSSS
ncbi:uncharacterized protein V1510DRAFT_415563 [Dipodascopsis tothii]|uniref:uncharacterized protein n=1 Tax=Dipodascopsis tothii TaxID=44089 RepID=UPI0034CF96B8